MTPTPPEEILKRLEEHKEEIAASPRCAVHPSGFVQFWNTYPSGPRRVNKSGCLKKWKASKLEAKAADIIAGLERWKHSAAWRKDGGQYICLAMTFLNQARWEEDPGVDHHHDRERGQFPETNLNLPIADLSKKELVNVG